MLVRRPALMSTFQVRDWIILHDVKHQLILACLPACLHTAGFAETFFPALIGIG
jgi:hypothetical protein